MGRCEVRSGKCEVRRKCPLVQRRAGRRGPTRLRQASARREFEGSPKSEIRSPRSEGNPKARNPRSEVDLRARNRTNDQGKADGAERQEA